MISPRWLSVGVAYSLPRECSHASGCGRDRHRSDGVPCFVTSWLDNGTVTGVAGGVAIIEARAGARKGQAAVQVVGAPPATPAGGATQPTGGPPAPAPSGVDAFAGQVVGTGPAAVLRIEPPTVYLLP